MELTCLYTRLSDVPKINKELYLSCVNSLTSDFHLEISLSYKVIGIEVWKNGIVRLFIIESDEYSYVIRNVPAILFDFTWKRIPSDWMIRVNTDINLEILPTELTKIDYWFEKYVDDDPIVLEIVNKIRI